MSGESLVPPTLHKAQFVEMELPLRAVKMKRTNNQRLNVQIESPRNGGENVVEGVIRSMALQNVGEEPRLRENVTNQPQSTTRISIMFARRTGDWREGIELHKNVLDLFEACRYIPTYYWLTSLSTSPARCDCDKCCGAAA